ncbi:hypothetical protein [uncultured Methanospirillum sp.]|uniref:hypothetical protein n=1 Tax=uncultured Methanospirillum sp. TaxID=262503 RepID=UPI0029C630F1|nr:hypothetical protein [uncultured Methanospirillum sp.]
MKSILSGILVVGFLVICGVTIGDVLSSSVICDGSYWIHSSIRDSNETYALNLMTTNKAATDRTVHITNGIDSSISTNSTGVLGIDEYFNHLQDLKKIESPVCVFDIQAIPNSKQDEVYVSGLLDSATYASSRSTETSDKTSAKTFINGSGLILMDKQSSNKSVILNDMASIHGNMSILDYIEFGDE